MCEIEAISTEISLNPYYGLGQGIPAMWQLHLLLELDQVAATVAANFWKKSSATFLARPLPERCPGSPTFPQIWLSSFKVSSWPPPFSSRATFSPPSPNP